MATSLLQLRTKSQMLYDVAGSDVLDDDEWDELVNDGYRALWDAVVDVNPRFRSTPKRFNLTGNSERVIASNAADNFNVSTGVFNASNGAFSAGDVGSTLTLFYSGSANAPISGTYTVAAYASATSVTLLPLPPVATTNPIATADYYVIEGACVRLPDDFRDVYLVKSDPGTDSERILNRYPARIAAGSWDRSYDVRDRRLYIEPRQRAQGSYEVLYTPNPMELVNDTDTIDQELDKFRAFIPYHVANAALAREESDMIYAPQFAMEAARVAKWARNQRSAEPDTVEDVKGRSRWSIRWGTP